MARALVPVMTSRARLLANVVEEVVRRPRSLQLVLSDDARFQRKLLRHHGRDKLSSIDLVDLVPDMHETLRSYTYLSGTSPVPDLVLLKSLARKVTPCTYLEIGAWRGESLVNVADVAEACYAVTLGPVEMRALSFSEPFVAQHAMFVRDLENVTIIEHDARTFDFESLDVRFNLVFVDGDHSYDAVRSDTANVFKVLQDENSIVVWHDYGFDPERVRASVLAGILDGVPEDAKPHLYHVTNTMCAIYMRTMAPTRQVSFPDEPRALFDVEVSARRLS